MLKSAGFFAGEANGEIPHYHRMPVARSASAKLNAPVCALSFLPVQRGALGVGQS
jgi:hypothetical protein